MNNLSKSQILILLIFLLVTTTNTNLMASPPPPPGVPIDAGISLLVVAALGYGAHKMKDDQEI